MDLVIVNSYRRLFRQLFPQALMLSHHPCIVTLLPIPWLTKGQTSSHETFRIPIHVDRRIAKMCFHWSEELRFTALIYQEEAVPIVRNRQDSRVYADVRVSSKSRVFPANWICCERIRGMIEGAKTTSLTTNCDF